MRCLSGEAFVTTSLLRNIYQQHGSLLKTWQGFPTASARPVGALSEFDGWAGLKRGLGVCWHPDKTMIGRIERGFPPMTNTSGASCSALNCSALSGLGWHHS